MERFYHHEKLDPLVEMPAVHLSLATIFNQKSTSFMKILLPFFFIIAALPAMFSQNFAGKYTGEFNGDPVKLTLEKAGTGKWSGLMNDSQQEYKVNANSNGSQLIGTANCESLGISFDLSGQLKGNKLDLKLVFLGMEMPVVLTKSDEKASTAAANSAGSGGSAPMPKLPANAQHDSKLVGTWARQENYNSGSGMDGYYSNNSYMALNADGTLSDMGSETMVGSNAGSGRSSSGGSGVVPGLKWYSEKNSIFLVATDGKETQTVRLGRYYIENGALLITADDGTKMLYYKQ